MLTGILRHEGYLRGHDEEIEWEKLFSMFCRKGLELKKWTKQAWLNHLERRSDEKRFRCCLASNGYIPFMRHISRPLWRKKKFDLSLQDNVQIPYNWREYIHHGGSSRCRSSIVQSGLIAGGTDSKGGRQTVFLHSNGSYERTTKRRTLRCEGATRGTLSNEVEKCTRMQFIGST